MTVKELKAKLTNIPEDASVEMVICNTDNPFEEGCRVDKIAYFEWLQKDERNIFSGLLNIFATFGLWCVLVTFLVNNRPLPETLVAQGFKGIF